MISQLRHQVAFEFEISGETIGEAAYGSLCLVNYPDYSAIEPSKDFIVVLFPPRRGLAVVISASRREMFPLSVMDVSDEPEFIRR